MYNIEYKIDIKNYLQKINWISNAQQYQYIVDEQNKHLINGYLGSASAHSKNGSGSKPQQ